MSMLPEVNVMLLFGSTSRGSARIHFPVPVMLMVGSTWPAERMLLVSPVPARFTVAAPQ
jgi:hypothetical protein